jgi:hypothetical protein
MLPIARPNQAEMRAYFDKYVIHPAAENQQAVAGRPCNHGQSGGAMVPWPAIAKRSWLALLSKSSNDVVPKPGIRLAVVGGGSVHAFRMSS